MPDKIVQGLNIVSTAKNPTVEEVNQKMSKITDILNDSLSTAKFADGANQKEGVVYRNPNIQDGVGSHWSHSFMSMGG